MKDPKTDKMPANSPAAKDGGESTGLMEPLAVSRGARHRLELTDLAVELVSMTSGLRRSLPEGIVTALSVANC